VNNRLQKLCEKFGEKEIDAIFITQSENRRYLSGFNGSAGFLIITNKKAVLATDFRYTEQAVAEAPDFEILRIANNIKDWFPGLVEEMKINRLGFESGDVSFQFHQQLSETLKKKKLILKMVPVNGLVESVRAVKESAEIKAIIKSSAITDAAYESVVKSIKPGITEKEVAWELEKTLREKGSQALPFEIIVASGPRAALPHAKPTDRVIEDGDTVVIDMGAKYEGYASDLTRTICVGAVDDTFKNVYNTVLKAQSAAMATIHKGIAGKKADNAAREIIEKAGYGEAFGHSLGHGVGLAPHELPRLGPNSEDILTDGMVFTVEPGIYISGWGGVRIEDTVVMEKGRAKSITKAVKAETFDLE
jgi:Xaa-Pro aminopeptidase